VRPVPQICIDFLKGAEGCRLAAYQDVGGVWTVGYGHVTDGPGAITQAQADSFLFADATKAAIRLASVVKDSVIEGLTEHQYAALVSFCLNLGVNPSWTLWPLLNAGKFDCIPVQMMRFDKAKVRGQLVEVPGLFNRRAAEVALWKTADVAGAITIAQTAPAPSSADTSTRPTPPTPMSPKPAWSSKTLLTSIATLGATGAAAAQNALTGAKAAIAPYVADSPLLTALNGHMALVAAGLAVATTAFAYLKTRNTQ
jgi:lysozyme